MGSQVFWSCSADLDATWTLPHATRGGVVRFGSPLTTHVNGSEGEKEKLEVKTENLNQVFFDLVEEPWLKKDTELDRESRSF